MGKSLSVKEAAAQLGLSEGKVKAMCVSGELEAVKFGNRWKVTEEEVSRVQHGEAPNQVKNELKKIGIVDVEEFIKFREALQQAQVVQDNKEEELNEKDELVNRKYEACKAVAIKAGQLENKRAKHIALLKEAVETIENLQSVYACFSQGNLSHDGLSNIMTQLEEEL